MGKLRLLLLLVIGLHPFLLKGQEMFSFITGYREMPLTFVDSLTIYKLLERGYSIQKTNPDSALMYYRSALGRSELSNRTSYKARVFSYFASYYVSRVDYPTAIKFLLQSAEAYTKMGQHPLKQYVNLTSLYKQMGAYDQAIAIYRKALLKPEANAADSVLVNKMICNVAGSYWELGITDSASRLYYQVIERAKTIDSNYITLITAYVGISNILMRLEQWDKTWAYIARTESLALRYRDSVQYMNIIANKGTIHYQQKHYEQAKQYHYQALAYARRKKDPFMIYSSTFIIGATLAKQGRFRQAQSYAKEAYDNALLNRSTTEWLSASYLMGCVHTHTQHYNIAKRYLLPAVKYAEQYHNLANIGDGYDHLSTICSGLGQYREALRYKEKQLRAENNVAGKENAGRIAEIEMKYKTAEKDKQIAQKELLLSRQQHHIGEKNIWIGSLGAGALLLMIVILNLYSRKRHKEKLHKAYIANLEKDREIVALKAKMEGEEEERIRLARDLHDGVVVKFSAVKMNLSVLPDQHSSLEGAEDFQKIISRLDEATTELRTTAHNLLPDALLEGGLSEAVHYFCKDIQQSCGVEIHYRQYTDIPRFLPGFELSVYRIIQELLQNILKHAAATKAFVQLIYDGEILNITIEDNGKGFNPDNLPGSGGMGLKNLKSRVASLEGYVDIRSNPGKGTSVYMEFTAAVAV